MTIELQDLELRVSVARKELQRAEQAVEDFKSLPENNVFETLEDAEELEDILCDKASDDCEGSYNCGLKFYEQLFYVQGELYKATLFVDYNRHDKQYYYIDGTRFVIEKVSK